MKLTKIKYKKLEILTLIIGKPQRYRSTNACDFVKVYGFHIVVSPKKIVNSLDYTINNFINNAIISNNISLDLNALERFLLIMVNLILFLSLISLSFILDLLFM